MEVWDSKIYGESNMWYTAQRQEVIDLMQMFHLNEVIVQLTMKVCIGMGMCQERHWSYGKTL